MKLFQGVVFTLLFVSMIQQAQPMDFIKNIGQSLYTNMCNRYMTIGFFFGVMFGVGLRVNLSLTKDAYNNYVKFAQKKVPSPYSTDPGLDSDMKKNRGIKIEEIYSFPGYQFIPKQCIMSCTINTPIETQTTELYKRSGQAFRQYGYEEYKQALRDLNLARRISLRTMITHATLAILLFSCSVHNIFKNIMQNPHAPF